MGGRNTMFSPRRRAILRAPRRKQRVAHSSSKEWHARFSRGWGGGRAGGVWGRGHAASYFTPGEGSDLATSLPARANLGSCPLGNHNSWLRFCSLFVVFLMGRVFERRPDPCHFLSPVQRLSREASAPVVCLLNASSSERLQVFGVFCVYFLCVWRACCCSAPH